MSHDSPSYRAKKKFLNKVLTVFGRKPALEAVMTSGVKIYRVHLSDSNKPAKILDDIVSLAEKQNAEICYHDRKELSRISKNSKQDQGVAVDLLLPGFEDFDDFLEQSNQSSFELIALDRITNPQNLGMIIRSVCASPMRGILLPNKGCAKLDSLVIKASAGTVFKSSIIRCDSLEESLQALRERGANVVGLDVRTNQTLADYSSSKSTVFVLGNETDGISKEVNRCCTTNVTIPMANNVESLNVAITASLIAFRSVT